MSDTKWKCEECNNHEGSCIVTICGPDKPNACVLGGERAEWEKAPTGRPELPPEEKRGIKIQFRVNQKEESNLRGKAACHGQNIGKYIRDKLEL